jgi:hypothetical protein
MSLLTCPQARQILRDIPMAAGFMCHKVILLCRFSDIISTEFYRKRIFNFKTRRRILMTSLSELCLLIIRSARNVKFLNGNAWRYFK